VAFVPFIKNTSNLRKGDKFMKILLRHQIIIFALPLFAIFIFAGAASASSNQTLIISGTGSSISAMQLMAKGFQKKHPGVTVNVLPSIGTTGGIKAVNEDKIDIGLANRPLKPEERSAKAIEMPYARTAFIFGVQNSNPTKGFTLEQLEEIYAGKRKTWPDGTHIRLVLRPLSDAFSAYLANINPGFKSAAEKSHSIRGLFVGGTDQEAAGQIEKTSGSLGITSYSVVTAEKRNIKALSVDGVTPTPSNVSAGKYPYAMTLSLIYKKDKYKGAVKDFIEFVFSREGQKILFDNGHVTLQRITGK
jgi:phosphate transport system substrate-binding protein